MIRATQNFELFDKTCWSCWQSVDDILEDVSVAETFVWCLTINLKTTIFQLIKHYWSPMCNPGGLKLHHTWHTRSILKKTCCYLKATLSLSDSSGFIPPLKRTTFRNNDSCDTQHNTVAGCSKWVDLFPIPWEIEYQQYVIYIY